jgi:ethanolamine utilization protein EutQ (cupin superfamily)
MLVAHDIFIRDEVEDVMHGFLRVRTSRRSVAMVAGDVMVLAQSWQMLCTYKKVLNCLVSTLTRAAKPLL